MQEFAECLNGGHHLTAHRQVPGTTSSRASRRRTSACRQVQTYVPACLAPTAESAVDADTAEAIPSSPHEKSRPKRWLKMPANQFANIFSARTPSPTRFPASSGPKKGKVAELLVLCGDTCHYRGIRAIITGIAVHGIRHILGGLLTVATTRLCRYRSQCDVPQRPFRGPA